MRDTANWLKKWWPVAVIILALTGWGMLLAIGAYFQLGGEGASRDSRKFWIVLGSMAAFLGLWGVALWRRSIREQGKR